MKISHHPKCALCEEPLTGKNRTKEHIIPNSIGGRRKTTSFICNKCNNKLGEEWDADLAKQLNWLSLVAGISRERGEPPKQLVETIEGEKYWLHSDGSFTPEKSSYTEEDQGETVTIRLIAKTTDEAKQRLKGILKKYPKLDIEKAFDTLKMKTSHLESPINFSLSFGGHNAGRSLVKTAFAFASECGIEHSACNKVIQYLRDESLCDIPFGFSYISDLVENRPNDKIFHCVSLHGDPKTQKLWSYIEYFGCIRVVVLLSDSYSGEYKNEIYSIDPTEGNSVSVRIRTDISAEELTLIWSGDGLNNENHKAAADYALPIILKTDHSRALSNAVKEGFDYAAKKLNIKEQCDIPNELYAEFSALFMEKLLPYIEYLVKSSRQRG